jgi:GWxTD domain-containing protein
MRALRWGFGAALILLASAGAGCRLEALRRSLPPGHADFLSKVRYIITRPEEKVFLELPDSKRDDFIDEFWKRRNPDPYSAVNEFKIEYERRLQAANRLFVGEARPGWLTDRGRIYILFGSPLDRIINPISRSSEERCGEIWYYGGFPVAFRDRDCSGTYELVTYDLTGIRQYNLIYMHELNQAQDRAQKTSYRGRAPFDFRARVELAASDPGRIEGVIRLSIPYVGIWFKEPDVGSLVTTLEVEIELRDTAGDSRWRHDETFDVTIREEILEQEQGESLTRDIPFAITENLERLRHGKNKLQIRLKNHTGGEEQRRTLEVWLAKPGTR